MTGDRRGWVDAFDRVPVNYSPPAAAGAEPQAEAIPLARHRPRVRRRGALALLRAVALRVLARLASRKAGVDPSLRSG